MKYNLPFPSFKDYNEVQLTISKFLKGLKLSITYRLLGDKPWPQGATLAPGQVCHHHLDMAHTTLITGRNICSLISRANEL